MIYVTRSMSEKKSKWNLFLFISTFFANAKEKNKMKWFSWRALYTGSTPDGSFLNAYRRLQRFFLFVVGFVFRIFFCHLYQHFSVYSHLFLFLLLCVWREKCPFETYSTASIFKSSPNIWVTYILLEEKTLERFVENKQPFSNNSKW